METHKRLYKTTRNAPTLSERVKKANIKRNDTRKNAFNANRQIDLDDSISTPRKPVPVKISQIKDKPHKLRAYIEQKKNAKFKEAVETRSPFIPYVPVGRWLPKKEEPARRPRNLVITTPVRKALMNDGKILKKATMKELVTTAKKTAKKPLPVVEVKKDVKSRKKILVESNEIERVVEPVADLNSTFEILSDSAEDENIKPEEIKNEVSKAQNVEKPKDIPTKSIVTKSEPLIVEKPKEITLKSIVSKSEPLVEEKPKKPIISKPQRVKRDIRKVEKKPKAVPVVPVPAKKVTAKIVKPVKKPVVRVAPLKVQEPQPSAIESSQEEQPQVTSKPKEQSRLYKFYKSSLDNQRNYLTLQLSDISNNLESFIQLLPEDTQTLIHKNIQHGNLIINEKMNKFMNVLNNFEEAIDGVTEEDVENYWDLLYEEINKFKEELSFMREAKKFAVKEVASQKKKRRTSRAALDATPRRSRRVADLKDTPNNHSCFGCTPISSSKVNTPKSNKKRRTLFKNKELSFD